MMSREEKKIHAAVCGCIACIWHGFRYVRAFPNREPAREASLGTPFAPLIMRFGVSGPTV